MGTLTARQLIDQLHKVPGDTPVLQSCEVGSERHPVTGVYIGVDRISIVADTSRDDDGLDDLVDDVLSDLLERIES